MIGDRAFLELTVYMLNSEDNIFEKFNELPVSLFNSESRT